MLSKHKIALFKHQCGQILALAHSSPLFNYYLKSIGIDVYSGAGNLVNLAKSLDLALNLEKRIYRELGIDHDR